MKGQHRIVIRNKRIQYDFVLKRNLTVIRGDSATGKTTLIDMVREFVKTEKPVASLCNVIKPVQLCPEKDGKQNYRRYATVSCS